MSYSALQVIGFSAVRRFTAAGMLLTSLAVNLIPGSALAAELNLPRDGWASWRVTAAADAPHWCCYQWRGKRPVEEVCELDGRQIHYGGHGDAEDIDRGPVTHMQIYAFMEHGEPQKIRALSSACPVKTKTAIADLGSVAADESTDWLASYITPHSDISTHALAAVAVHAGDRSRHLLINTARMDESHDNRMDAVFWMGQVRALETEQEIKRIMFADRHPKVRQHAAFSLSQSVIPDRADALIRLGNTDKSADVRAQAWFWLAQTAADNSESAIRQALQTEQDREVRGQAIFALSQLPEDRAVTALAAIIEDQELSRYLRKKALFWMAHNESEQAVLYLENILALE